MQLSLSGCDHLKLVAGADAYEPDWEAFADHKETEVGRELLQNAVAWVEIADGSGIAGQIDAAEALGCSGVDEASRVILGAVIGEPGGGRYPCWVTTSPPLGTGMAADIASSLP